MIDQIDQNSFSFSSSCFSFLLFLLLVLFLLLILYPPTSLISYRASYWSSLLLVLSPTGPLSYWSSLLLVLSPTGPPLSPPLLHYSAIAGSMELYFSYRFLWSVVRWSGARGEIWPRQIWLASRNVWNVKTEQTCATLMQLNLIHVHSFLFLQKVVNLLNLLTGQLFSFKYTKNKNALYLLSSFPYWRHSVSWASWCQDKT